MENINNIQISAIFKIPEGHIEEFKRRVTNVMEEIKEKGTTALKYDVFINSEKNECEVREEYQNSEDLIEHMTKFREFLQVNFFNDFPLDHVALYGTPSPQLLEMAKGIDIRFYSFFQGLEEMIEA
jgi:quinol monooxygenase YgiN